MNNEITKMIVNLKRKPQVIPMILLCISCAVYTFNLTAHSNAAIYVSNQIIALYVFILTLCSMLTIFSYMSAYKKGKVFWPMMIVALLMLAIQIGLDIACHQIYFYEVFYRENPVPLTDDVAKAINGTVMHLVMLGISTLAVVLLPFYHKLILRIPTQVTDEEGDNLGEDEEISSEESEEDDDL